MMKKPIYIILSWLVVVSVTSLACGLGTSEVPVSPATMAAQTVEAVTHQAATDTAATQTAEASFQTPTIQPATAEVTETVVPATDTPTPKASSAPVPVNFGGASFTVPAGLASQAKSELVQAVAFNDDSPLEPGSPAHLRFSFENYPLSGTEQKPEITVYPADLYGRFHTYISSNLSDMHTLLETGSSTAAHLPFLPFYNAGQVFHSQFKMINFQAGKGYRFLTKYAQDASPITNKTLFYTYQALSSDGQYVISVIMPLHSKVLPESLENPAVPAGGIAAPNPGDSDYGTKYKAYVQQIQNLLDHQANDQFTPNLDALDQMAASLNLNTVTGLIPGCPALLASGTKAYVSSDPPVSNRLRSAPSKSSSTVGSIAPGTLILLVSGPTCADNLVFWKVTVPSQKNITAYTAESDLKEQWLRPCPTSGNCPP